MQRPPTTVKIVAHANPCPEEDHDDDLEKDPDELTNQYGDPHYAATIAQLKQDLERLRGDYKDNTDISVMPAEWQKKFREIGL